MLVFPNAKINIGLYVTGRRPDGYHDIRSILYPIPLSDILEFIAVPDRKSGTEPECSCFGFPLDDGTENLCVRAYRLLCRRFSLPALHMGLYKNIPVGAGLGGGSSDGAFMLKALNEAFSLGLTRGELADYALQLGSDCPFFIRNRPSLVTGRGEIIEPFEPVLSGLHVVVVFPGIRVNTGEAYAALTPAKPRQSLEKILSEPVETWKERLVNHFEPLVSERYPEISGIRDELYRRGAVYASLTGSGSAVYGIFHDPPGGALFPGYYTWEGRT